MATRREKVILELEDNFTSGMARAAASTALLDKSLKGLDGSTVKANREFDALGAPSGGLAKTRTQMVVASKEIDRTSGRLRLFVDAATTLGPALVPIGAVAVPAVAGLAAQFGAAALAGGTALAAFQGIGDTLEAVNKAALEPTTANLEAARIAMQGLSPQARDLVKELQGLRPELLALRDSAAAGLFPGLVSALDGLDGVLPRVERVLFAIGDALGDVAGDFGEAIAGPRMREFLDFIAAEVPVALRDLGVIVGNLAGGLAELWMAFTPLNRDFSGFMVDAARGFDAWAQGLSQTDGFQEFVAYVRENGPRVASALAAMGNALLQVVQAAAPLGGPVLGALEAVANVIAAIAGSEFGPAIFTAVAAMTALSRAIKGIQAIRASSLFTSLVTSSTEAGSSLTKLGRAAQVAGAGLGALAIVDALQGGLKDYSVGVEQMTDALLDLQAAGASDLPAELDGLAGSIERLADPNAAQSLQDNLSDALGGIGGGSELKEARGQIEALDEALTSLVTSGRGELAQGALQGLGLTENQMEDLLSLMPQYRDALAGVANQSRIAGQASADGFNQARFAAQQFRTELERVNRLLERRASVRDFEQSLDDFTQSLRRNGRSLDINTQKGRENQAALDGIASTALKVAENLQGASRQRFLASARRDFVDAAAKILGTRDAAQALADKLGLIARTNPKPQVELLDRATAGLNALKARLDALDGDSANVSVTTTYYTVRNPVKEAQLPKKADGGLMRGPGGPRDDMIPAWLSNGEFVVNAAATQRNLGLLQQINAQKYADGGRVRPVPVQSAPSMHVSFDDMRGRFALDTPWGTQQIEAVASAVYRRESRAERRFDRRMDRD